MLINGELVERRIAGEHLGEMALVDPNAPRSASVDCGVRLGGRADHGT